MKAAVLHQIGQIPKFEDYPDPTPGEGELLIHVKAVALENIDKAIVGGKHFSSQQFLATLPTIIGLDGVGALDDGTLVGFGGIKPPYGALAERTIIPKGYFVVIPEGIDAITAAALPASALTALFTLKWAANLQAGETVLINGATSVSGKLAIQIAKLLGAGRIIGTGRHDPTLQSLTRLGADAVIDLKQPDDVLVAAFAKEVESGINVVIDVLWGHPTELLLEALTPHELGFAKRRVRLVQVGEMAGETLTLPAGALRTSGLEILGASANLTPEAIGQGTTMVWDLIREKKISMDIEVIPLKDIESAWTRTDLNGKRMVIVT